MIIYKVTNLINNKIYIGKTVNTLEYRKKQHLSDAKYKRHKMLLHRAIMKYGSENFVWEALDTVMFSDLLLDLEKFYIKKYNCKHPNGYNLTDGGEGICGHKFSEESRKKMSLAQKGIKSHMFGKPMNQDTKNKISISKMGHPVSQESINKMKETKRKNNGKNIFN